jgi:hypothetical protein
MNFLLWPINGFLALVYLAFEHLVPLTLIASAGWFALSTPAEQRTWAVASSGLAILASFLAPAPVPLFLLVLSLAGWAGLGVERYNRPAQRWNIIRSQALYALAGMGYALYRSLGLDAAMQSDPAMMQGAAYLNGLTGIAMYVIPLGFLAYLAQSIFAHPPAPGSPEELIRKVRTRRKD